MADIRCLACDPCDTRKGPNGEDIPNLISYSLAAELCSCSWEYYTLTLSMLTHKLRYHFQVCTLDGEALTFDESGLSQEKKELLIRPFFVAYTYPQLCNSAPEWAGDMVWYQIFPDRFAGPELWNSTPVKDKNLVCGGTLAEIQRKIPYLKELGITGIYLNPIFQAASIHRYDTIDYYAVDPMLGTESDLVALCDACHKSGLRVMLDGVYNHCSYKLPQFQDVMQQGKASSYYDWFFIHNADRLKGLNASDIDTADFRKDAAYETFAFVPSMPKFNTENPEVMEYLIGSAEYWTKKCHIDAWRLDVPDEVNVKFLRQFRQHIKAIDPGIYIIGEFWCNAKKWLNGELFDGAMNYLLYFSIRDFLALGSTSATVCADALAKCLMEYPAPIRRGMFNFCSTHDVPRILWHCGENRELAGLNYLLTSALEGGLSVYYGDEVGMTGGYDPDNRRCYPWKSDRECLPILSTVAKAISLKKSGFGSGLRRIYAPDKDVLRLDYADASLLINRASEKKVLEDGIILTPYSHIFLANPD